MEIIHMAFKIFSCRWSKYLQKTITGIVTIVTISTSNSKHIHEVYSHSIFVISLRVTSLIRVAVSDNYSHQSKYCFMNVPAAYFIIFFTILFSLIQEYKICQVFFFKLHWSVNDDGNRQKITLNHSAQVSKMALLSNNKWIAQQCIIKINMLLFESLSVFQKKSMWESSSCFCLFHHYCIPGDYYLCVLVSQKALTRFRQARCTWIWRQQEKLKRFLKQYLIWKTDKEDVT